MQQTLRQSIQQELVTLGWAFGSGSAIASKDYDTAVGVKTAHIYLGWEQDNAAPAVWLQGDYLSEGNNVLSGCSVPVDRQSSAENIALRVKDFSDKADRAIDQSYARGLYLRRPRS